MKAFSMNAWNRSVYLPGGTQLTVAPSYTTDL